MEQAIRGMCAQVIPGPWPGTGDAPQGGSGEEPAVRVVRVPGPAQPHQIRVDAFTTVLMYCAGCGNAFRRGLPVPHDKRCLDCKPDDQQLELFPVVDEEPR